VFIPVLLFSILFGLSMDYEVFLVSRIQEEWLLKRDNGDAVMTGQAETGRVITAAALDHDLVFASFVLGGSIIIKQFGIGLAGAIIIDAFIVRTILVPALNAHHGPVQLVGCRAGSTASSPGSTWRPPAPSRPSPGSPGPASRSGNAQGPRISPEISGRPRPVTPPSRVRVSGSLGLWVWR